MIGPDNFGDDAKHNWSDEQFYNIVCSNLTVKKHKSYNDNLLQLV